MFNEKGEAYIYEKRVAKGTFMENLELDDFPFDVQVSQHFTASIVINRLELDHNWQVLVDESESESGYEWKSMFKTGRKIFVKLKPWEWYCLLVATTAFRMSCFFLCVFFFFFFFFCFVFFCSFFFFFFFFLHCALHRSKFIAFCHASKHNYLCTKKCILF